jgi:hypothetical protein
MVHTKTLFNCTDALRLDNVFESEAQQSAIEAYFSSHYGISARLAQDVEVVNYSEPTGWSDAIFVTVNEPPTLELVQIGGKHLITAHTPRDVTKRAARFSAMSTVRGLLDADEAGQYWPRFPYGGLFNHRYDFFANGDAERCLTVGSTRERSIAFLEGICGLLQLNAFVDIYGRAVPYQTVTAAADPFRVVWAGDSGDGGSFVLESGDASSWDTYATANSIETLSIQQLYPSAP